MSFFYFLFTKKSLMKDKKNSSSSLETFYNISDYKKLSYLRAKCKRLAKSDYNNYANKVQYSINKNSKYYNNSKNNNVVPQ